MEGAESIYAEAYSFVLPHCVGYTLMEKAVMQTQGAYCSLCPHNTTHIEVLVSKQEHNHIISYQPFVQPRKGTQMYSTTLFFPFNIYDIY